MKTDLAADPLLSANLYAGGHIDAAISRVLGPLAAQTPAPFYYLRYGRGGEHLKLRFYGDPAQEDDLRRRLESLAADFFASLPPPPEPPEPGAPPALQPPPIDAEDEDLTRDRGRSLLFTTYRRSYVPFAGPPFLGDDRLMACAGAVLCSAGGGFVTLFAGEEPPSHKTRQNVLLRLVPLGIAAYGIPAEERPAYLAYHRNWLVRWILGAFAADQQDQLLPAIGKFDAASRGSAAAFPSLRAYFGAEVRHFGEALDSELRHAFATLGEQARRVAADAPPGLDPYTSDASILPLFKAFHMCANALGLKMRDEAFAHHLLGAALAAE